MGFGILLIGYFLTFATALSTSYFFADIPGSVMILYAVYKLSRFSNGFKKTIPVSALFSLLCLFCALLSVFSFEGIIFNIASAARTAVVLVLHVFLFKSLEVMAQGAEDVKLASKAKRNLGFVMAYYLFFIIYTFISPMLDATLSNYFLFIMFILNLVFVVLNLLLLHSAYAKLYIEGTDNGEVFPEFKESRFKFIDPLRRRFYESQKRAYEENYNLMRESAEYAKNNPAKKNKSKKKKKQK